MAPVPRDDEGDMVKCGPGERGDGVRDRVDNRGPGEWEGHFRRCSIQYPKGES